jgi:O-antigen/teichoic acid export membrane protein
MKNKNLRIVILTVILPVTVRLFFLNFISNNVDPSIYGKIVLIEIYIVGITSVLNSILYQAYDRFYNESNKEKFINEFRSYLIVINLISSLILLIIGLFNGYSILLIIIVCAYACCMNNYLFFQNIYFINLKRKKFLIIKLVEGFIKFLFPIASYYLFETIESFLIGIIVGYAISNLIFKVFLKLNPLIFKVNKSNLIKYLKFGSPIILTSMFSWSISFVDRLFLEAIISISIVGTYSILSQLSGFAQVVGSIYSTYINPIIFKKHSSNKKNTFIVLKRYLKILSFICLGMFTLICLTPKSVFGFIIAEDIIQNQTYYYSFLILTLGIFLAIFQTALSMYFILIKRLDIHSKIFSIAAILNFGLNFFIIKYGILAAAISTALAYLIINLLILYWLKINLRLYQGT